METVKISSKFELVIPVKIRETLNLKVGQRMRMITFDGKIEVFPVSEAKSLRGFAKRIDTSIKRGEDRL